MNQRDKQDRRGAANDGRNPCTRRKIATYFKSNQK
jgi:hypothetical protein